MMYDYGRISVHPPTTEKYWDWSEEYEFYSDQAKDYPKSFVIWLVNQIMSDSIIIHAINTSQDWEYVYDMYLRAEIVVSAECDECGETSHLIIGENDTACHAECSYCEEIL
ncbi:hypothetical protein AB0I72_27435, partial [Nocardiopsis sp. NPDC049922]|uniref:hypothetical protein n=1 Tax=Nocardiopsis sp. NPDC049922 TaxID=3155157 RepID=UPI0033CDAA02